MASQHDTTDGPTIFLCFMLWGLGQLYEFIDAITLAEWMLIGNCGLLAIKYFEKLTGVSLSNLLWKRQRRPK